jgi:UDP-2,3-diacylglucosamine pyrophosphatase LpxH
MKTDSRRLVFNLTSVYRPNSARVWIEHGNNYDASNQFHIDEYDPLEGTHSGRSLYWDEEKPPILKDKRGIPRLYECLGTKFMIQFLNYLDKDYPFVDNVKPFKKFLQVFGASVFVSSHGPIKANLAVWRMLRYVTENAVTDPAGLLPAVEVESNPIALLIAERIKQLSVEQSRAFHQAIRERKFELDRSALTLLQDPEMSLPFLFFLAENLDLLDIFPEDDPAYLRSSTDNSGYLTLSKRGFVNETEELMRAARSIIADCGAETVIMGHTHEPVSDSGLHYFNTGSWTRNYDFKDRKLTSWEILRPGSQKYFPYELNYVELSDSTEPRMETYTRGN